MLKQNAFSKMTPPFEPQPYRVVSKAGSSVTFKSSSGMQYNRNSSYLINGSNPLGESQEVLIGDVCTRPSILRKMRTRLKDFELYQQGITQNTVATTSDCLSCLVLLISQLLFQKGEGV